MPQRGSVALQTTDTVSQTRLLKSDRRRTERGDVDAVEYLRRMRGGAQSLLLRCSDGSKYVVKFQNNPQGKRVLANELLGTLLARKLGLPTAKPLVVQASMEFVQKGEYTTFQHVRGRQQMQAGLCFGSRYLSIAKPKTSTEAALESAIDYLRAGYLQMIGNITDIAGFLVFDKWTCNTDRRQTIVVRDHGSKFHKVVMIDQGLCFNGNAWTFPDAPLRGIDLYYQVFERIPSFSNFELWLDRLEHLINRYVLEMTADEVPPEWYENDRDSLQRLLARLDFRRAHVADLVWSTWKYARKEIPHWNFPQNRVAWARPTDARQLRFADDRP